MWITLTILSWIGLLGLGFVCLRFGTKLKTANDRRTALETELDAVRRTEVERARIMELRQIALFNNMVEGVLTLDERRCVELFNPPLEKLLGVTENVKGRNIIEILRLPRFTELLDRLDVEGEIRDFDLELPGPPSRFLQVNAVAISIGPQGSKRTTLLAFYDLTEFKRLEDARTDFVANVSHELRTPLGMISGYVETLQNGAREDPQLVEKFLDTIERHTKRLTALIEDLLTLAGVESGHMSLDAGPRSLSRIVDHVVEDLSRKAAEKSVTLVNRVGAELHAEVDADRIHQVVFNLVDNAIKYGSEKSDVTVDGRMTGGAVEISVRNAGPGIADDAQKRLFERFYRVDSARSREQGGTGLGLAIVKHIVQAHGGEVGVESRSGDGARFFFTVTAASGDAS
jgi:two-component system phosphate regulon sensor histidine kinase PhoR